MSRIREEGNRRPRDYGPPSSDIRTASGSDSVVPLNASCSSPDRTSSLVGLCSTSTDAVTLACPEVAVSVPAPFPAAVTVAMDPLPLTVNTAASELDQLTDDAPGSLIL